MKLRSPNRFLSATLAATGFAMSLCISHAADQTWLHSVSPTFNWSTAPADANWDAGVVWTQNNNAIFGGIGETVSITEPINAGGLTFSATGYIINSSASANTLTLASGSVIDTGANTATINSALGGSGAITKSGSGTLLLGGANATYTGAVTLNAGTLQLNGATTLGTSNAITFSGNNATLLINPIGVALGAMTVNSGVTEANISFTQNSTTVSHSVGGVTLNGSPLTINQSNNTGNNWNQLTWTSKITGGVAAGSDALIFNNTGGLQTYYTTGTGVTHDFTGNIHVKAGVVAVQGGTSNGTVPDSSMLIVDGPGTWRWNGTAFTETVDGLSGSGAITTNAGSYNLTINANNAANDATRGFSGSMANPASALILGGTGTQEFSGAGLNYSAATNLNNGTLRLTKTTAWNSNIVVGGSNSPTLQLNTPLVADPTWTFAKQITGTNTSAKIEKIGLGTVLLTPAASSSFSGSSTGALTVTGGKLYLNSAFSTAPAVSVANAATFGGTSATGNIAVATGGTLEGGYNGSGTLTAGDVSIPDTATLKGTLAASPYKPLAVTNLTLGGADASLTLDASGVGLVEGTAYDVLVSTNVITAPNATSVLSALKSNSRTLVPTVSDDGKALQLTYSSLHWTGGGDAVWNASSASNWTLNAGPEMFVANDVVSFGNAPTSSTVTISGANVSPAATTFNFTSESGTAYTLQGDFGIATGLLTKSGSGVLTITNANTFSGGTTVNGGRIRIGNNSALGTGAITFNGGAISSDGAIARTLANNIVLNSAATFGDATDNGNLILNGSLTGTGTLVKEGSGTVQLSQTTGTVTPNLQINSGTLNLNYAAGAVTYSGSITGSAGVLRLEGTGASGTTGLTLTGSNTFAGDVHIYGRRIFLDNASGNALSGANIIFKQQNWAWHDLTINRNEQIADTSVLKWENTGDVYEFRLNGKTETVGGLVAVSGNPAIIENAGHDSGLNDNGIAAGKLIVDVAASTTYSYFGALRNQNGGSNGVLSFEKKGAGTQILINDPSYTGTTTVTGGRLKIQDGTTPFASSGTAIASGTTFEINRTGANWTVSTVLSGGGILEKTGTGIVTLSGASPDFTGATSIAGGTLLVNNTLGTSASTLSVASTATLGGSGTLGGTATIEAGGIVAPGNAAIGTLSANNVTLAGTCQIEVGATASDLVAVAGTLTTSGSPTIAISTVGTPTAASYTIITYGTLTGTLPTITPPAGYTVDTATTGVVRLVKSGFSSWADKFPGLTDKTPGGDPDHDGITNLMEYVLGGDPRTSSTEFLPTQAIVGSDLVISYKRSDDSLTDTTQTGQWSSDLATWTDIEPVMVNDNEADPDDMTVTIPLSNAANGKLFGRIHVTQP